MKALKYISILGASGSIGTQTLDIIRSHPDEFQLAAISIGKNVDMARAIIEEFAPRLVAVAEADAYDKLRSEYAGNRLWRRRFN